MSCKLSPPRAPTDHLRLESFRVLSRLVLITELRPWLGNSNSAGTPGSAFQTLWTCLSLGAPLCALLNMLAPPYIDVEVDYDLPLDGRITFFTNFIERVKLLEMQGRLTYGEVLRVDDMYGETCTGFAKVLKTVQRVLVALQGTCPDLYVAPPRAEQQRRAFVQSLLHTEQLHVSALGSVAEAALLMSTATGTVEPRLECLLVNRSHLREYHSQVLAELQQISNSPWLEDWIRVFGTNKPAFITRTVSAYRSICVNCLPIHEFLIKQLTTIDPELRGYAQTLLDIVGRIPARLAEYCANLSAILRVSTPSAHHSYDSLCTVVFRMQDASDTIDEMSRQIRTMRCSSILKARAFLWDPDPPSETGSLLLDGTLLVSEIGLSYSLFLFDTVLLCCLEEIGSECTKTSRYPVEPWELGRALKGTSMLSLAHSIPTQAIRQVYVFKSESFSILWVDPRGEENVLEFTTTCPAQSEQWCSLLSRFADMIYSRDDERDDVVSVDSGLDVNYRRRSRPWSVRGHKSSNSQASSTMQSDFGVNDLVLSPGMLPTLFNNGALSKSPPFSLDSSTGSRYSGFEPPPTPPPDFVPVDLTSMEVMDLTGKVKKEGRFSVAGGGFSDVFKGVWRDVSQERQVAIKVLRSRTDDPETESRIRQRLARELSVWKKINHPNILQLYGTVSDFGNYDSMVCPWFENGSVTKYLERRGDLLSMTDRLQLLIQVAEGLSYLHSLGIVHGDLTGSNILINDKGEAVLCDFGLSNMLAAFQGSSSSCMSSTIGGAIRWADASLYRLAATDDEDSEEDATTEPPFLTPPSDIYSFGSVALEILSGRIPYHYVRSDAQVVIELHRGRKPRRPAVSFVTEAQWKFIERCWADAMEDRPDALEVLATIQCLYKASLDFRRHSAP